MKRIIKSEKEMHALAAEVAKRLKGGAVLALVGDLGSGKTTFVKGLAKAFGVRALVQSPTFLLLKCYPIKKIQDSSPTFQSDSAPRVAGRRRYKIQSLCHVDAYRIKSAQELFTIGLGELIADPHVITAIEWADRVKKLIPRRAIRITFSHGKMENERIVEVKAPTFVGVPTKRRD